MGRNQPKQKQMTWVETISAIKNGDWNQQVQIYYKMRSTGQVWAT